ncbi:uncharacterized protein LOC142631114 [Castanea sativa]|uniref:uncharacterized protein LOC142631114 n=1 Tax=Castanea sativa TaxID=21020 RepID=UPI003F654665
MCKDLMNQWQHLQRVDDHFTTKKIANNQLQLKASVFIVLYLTFQAVAFRGQDESFRSLNRGNFLESLGIVTFWNEKVAEIIEKAPKNATYTSPRIQKETLHVFSTKVKKAIGEEIGDAKFCIIVDEAHDESMKEQMAVVFRYVDTESFVKECFFGLIHVVDTAALTLKKRTYSLLSQHCLDIENIRGQGYNRASNMREHWAEAESAYDGLTSFEFVFILHLEKETMEITHKLWQALQSQSQDILNSMHLVSSTKALIQKFRDDGWDGLLTTVISFCEKHCIDVLDMNASYVVRRG